jgi:hypothetical protein
MVSVLVLDTEGCPLPRVSANYILKALARNEVARTDTPGVYVLIPKPLNAVDGNLARLRRVRKANA